MTNQEKVDQLKAALNGCLDAMDMQMKREVGVFHIPLQTAIKIWQEAVAAAQKAYALDIKL